MPASKLFAAILTLLLGFSALAVGCSQLDAVQQTPSPSPSPSHSPSATASVPASPSATATTSPTHTPTAIPIATPSPAPTPLPDVVYETRGEIDPSARHLVALGIEVAREYLQEHGGAVERTVFVRITTSAECIHGISAVGYNVCVYVEGERWAGLDGSDRLKTVIHEYIHVLQHELGCYRIPQWLYEGMAEHAAQTITADAGFTIYAAELAKATALREDSGDRRPLADFENGRKAASPGDYANWLVATDQLAGGAGIAAARELCEAVGEGTPWDDAFAASFAVSVEDFYESFDP